MQTTNGETILFSDVHADALRAFLLNCALSGLKMFNKQYPPAVSEPKTDSDPALHTPRKRCCLLCSKERRAAR
jgi:hypothetical protein